MSNLNIYGFGENREPETFFEVELPQIGETHIYPASSLSCFLHPGQPRFDHVIGVIDENRTGVYFDREFLERVAKSGLVTVFSCKYPSWDATMARIRLDVVQGI